MHQLPKVSECYGHLAEHSNVLNIYFRLQTTPNVRPNLEHWICSSSPCLTKDATTLECVQCVGTKLMTSLSKLFYDE